MVFLRRASEHVPSGRGQQRPGPPGCGVGAGPKGLVNAVTPVPQLAREAVPFLGHGRQLLLHSPVEGWVLPRSLQDAPAGRGQLLVLRLPGVELLQENLRERESKGN